MSKLINFYFGTATRIYGSLEIGYFMRLKGRGERYIIADDAEIEKDRIKELI